MRPASRSLAHVCLAAALLPCCFTHAAPPESIRAAITKGSAFLVEKEQEADGSFSAEVGPAITAIAVTALVRSGTPADAPAVKKGLAYLL